MTAVQCPECGAPFTSNYAATQDKYRYCQHCGTHFIYEYGKVELHD